MTENPNTVRVNGYWITNAQGEKMFHPQTSALVAWQNELLSVSDASADPSQQRKIHRINPIDNTLIYPAMDIKISRKVRNSCFGQYLKDEPDYEGMAQDPDDPNILYLVTEDATRTGTLSRRCERRYQHTGSTDYPTLLVRIQRRQDGELVATDVRPLKYAVEDNVGNFPNDGIEGLTFGPERTLYLALEKDANSQPRIFALKITDIFWQSLDFASVIDARLDLPTFVSGNHPINALAYYQGKTNKNGFLLAAARNDNQLWVIDLDKERSTKMITFDFWVEADPSGNECEPFEPLHNASIEGIAVHNNALWLVNDPWMRQYNKNIRCRLNQRGFEQNAPILFNTPLQTSWFDETANTGNKTNPLSD